MVTIKDSGEPGFESKWRISISQHEIEIKTCAVCKRELIEGQIVYFCGVCKNTFHKDCVWFTTNALDNSVWPCEHSRSYGDSQYFCGGLVVE